MSTSRLDMSRKPRHPSRSIYQTWKINPNKEPDLHFNDWTEGFKDVEKIKNPRYPDNKGYM